MRICPKCNTKNQDDAVYCINCGAKLPGTMLALVCPNCGKVCPLGTKECPNCHHALPKNSRKVPMPRQSSRRFSKNFLRAIAGIAVILFVAFMAYSLGKGYTARSNSPYTVVTLTYYRSHQTQAMTQYFIVKQHIRSQQQTHFVIAYLGSGKAGQNRVRNNDIGVLRDRFNASTHYRFYIGNKRSNLSGPNRTKIDLSRQYVIRKSDKGSQFPTFKKRLFRCQVNGKPQYRYIHFDSPIANVNDD